MSMALDKALGLPGSTLWGFGGMDLQENWGISQLRVNSDLRAIAQVRNYC